MHWVEKSKLDEVELVEDFYDLIEVMESETLSEFQRKMTDAQYGEGASDYIVKAVKYYRGCKKT